jgi:uncharacterized protein involved in exopolysaccharide biosynthesis
MPPAEPQRKTPRDLLRVIFQRKTIFLLTASLVSIIALALSLQVPLKYTGTTRFERRSDAAAQSDKDRGALGFDQIRLTLTHELSGYAAIERAIEELGLTAGLPHNAEGKLTQAGQLAKREMIREIQEGLSVKWDVRSESIDSIRVSLTHHERTLAQKIPDLLVQNYINTVNQKILVRLKGSRDFLLKQFSNAEQRFKAAQKAKYEFENRYKVSSTEMPWILVERMQEMQAQAQANERQLEIARKNYAKLIAERDRIARGEAPSQVIYGPNPELERLNKELRGLRERLEESILLMNMTEKHPRVQGLRQSIELVKKRLLQTPPEIVMQKIYGSGEGIDSFAAQAAAAQAQIEIVEQRLEYARTRAEGYRDQQDNQNQHRAAYADLIEKVDNAEDEAQSWRGRLNQVEMALAAEAAKRRTHLETVERARRQFLPSSPNLLKLLAMSLGGGIIAGGALVFGLTLMDRTISTSEGAEKLFDVPCYGSIQEIVTLRERATRRLMNWLLWPAVSAVLIGAILYLATSLFLRLKRPDEYKLWQQSPTLLLQDIMEE